MADVDDRDFSQLSDAEIMGLGASDIARIAAAEQAKPEQVEETEEERQARETAEPQGDEGGPEELEDEDEEDDNPEVELPEETEEERLAREAEEEADLDDDELAELRANRETARGKVEEPAKPVNKKAKEPAAESFDSDGAKKLFEPFKANGRTMSIRNADEGVRLMQLGAGYNAKMAELKPKLAIVRTLEREGLLDVDKLSFLIDLHKKNPEAIGKLVKDSGVDVLDLDEDKVASYKAGNYAVSTKEVEVDEVLDSLRHSPTYSKLMDDVANKWDAKSKAEVGDNPGVLQIINSQMESGIYDTIVDEYERQKALGTIPAGTPFLAAYSRIGDELNAAGKFGTATTPPARKLVTPGKEKARTDREAVDKRRSAAAPTRKSGPAAPKKPVVDLWNMSDADFAKLNIR